MSRNPSFDAHINKPDYSKFDIGSTHKTTFDMGNIIPIFTKMTMPGDKINASVDAFVRGMPTVAPILDKVDIKINHFYVPMRVLWSKFTEWYTGSDTWKLYGGIKPEMPKFYPAPTGTPGANGKLSDYLGLSPLTNSGAAGNENPINALPWIAYQRIFLDYYAPQRWVEYLQTNGFPHVYAELNKTLEKIKNSDAYNMGNITANSSDARALKLQKVGWNHDYFTNALPTPTLFDDVKINLINSELPESYQYFAQDANGAIHLSKTLAPYNHSKLATVRNLRQNIAMQHYLEKMQQGGGRYIETMKVLWNQDLKNQELQRSQYLGGDVLSLFVNEVEQTAATDQGNLGDVGGKPVGAGGTEWIDFEADEFGYYMVLCHVVPKRSYQHAQDKMFFLSDPMELPNPEFEGLGDQAVLVRELNGGTGTEVFGYVPRFSEFKGGIDRYSGEMRTTLQHWHLGDLMSYPEISPEFITCEPREDIFNVPGEDDKLLGTFRLNCNVLRKLSANPQPGLTRI